MHFDETRRLELKLCHSIPVDGKLLWLRAGIASVLSQVVDTIIFITVAFYGVFPIAELLMWGSATARITRASSPCSCRPSHTARSGVAR